MKCLNDICISIDVLDSLEIGKMLSVLFMILIINFHFPEIEAQDTVSIISILKK